MARCAGGVTVSSMGKPATPRSRHPELVSGSIVPHSPPVAAEKWTLKQVQGDGGGFEGDDAGLVG